MAEYIKREDVNKIVSDVCYDRFGSIACGKEIIFCVGLLPAEDVVDWKRGKWRLNELGEVHCSECGAISAVVASESDEFVKEVMKDFHFCYNCGADMRDEV